MHEQERTGAFTSTSVPANYEHHLAPYLFEPWAEILLDAVGPGVGASVLDVASGTGVAARAAAARVGESGRVVATDISAAMIEFNAAQPAPDGAAPIRTAVAPATDLGAAGSGFDAVLCQQGMPFFPDRPAAAREFHRVLRAGGRVGIAVWTPGHDVLPFGPIMAAVRDAGCPAPYPGAWDEAGYVLDPDEVSALLADAGFGSVEAHEVELVTRWPGVQSLVDAVRGTPFGASLAQVDEARQQQAREQIAAGFAPFVQGAVVEVPTWSVIATATA